MTQQNMNNSGFKDEGYLEPQNSSGKTYGNLSYIESKRNLSNAERSVKLGNIDEAQSYLKEFTAISGLHHADLQKGFLGSSKVKENLSLIRNLSDNYNVSTINRYRDEALRRGQSVTAKQFLKLYEKSQQASVNMDAALETSSYLDEVLSKIKRSDSIEGITDLALSKLDEIRIKHLYKGNNLENAIERRIKDLDNNNWSFYNINRTKDFVGGVISNVSGIADLAGDFYTVITGSENPIKATEYMANLMDLDTNSKSYIAGNLAGFAAFTPVTAAGYAYKSASAGNKVKAAFNVLSSYATKEAAAIHAIHTGLAYAAMQGASIGASKIVESTNLGDNRKKALPNVVGFAAGAGSSILLHKFFGNTPNNANKSKGEGITRGGDSAFPEGESPSATAAEKSGKIFEEVFADDATKNKALNDINYGVSRESFEKTMEINNELSKKQTVNDVASQVGTEATEAETSRVVAKAKKATVTSGENYAGALLIDDQIYNITPENVEKGARNASNYNRKIQSDGKLSDVSTSLETDASVLYNKSTELANTEPSARASEVQKDLLIDKGEVSGIEENMKEAIEYLNQVVPTETLARLAEQGSIMIPDILRSEAIRVMDVNQELANSLNKIANVMDITLAHKSKTISNEGLLAKEILDKSDKALTNVLLDTAEISRDVVDLDKLNDVSYIDEVTTSGISELENNIKDSFSDKYDSLDSAVDRYLDENPMERDLLKKSATALVKELERSTKVGADGSSDYYFKSIIDKLTRETNSPKQTVVQALIDKIDNIGKSEGQGRAIREVLMSLDNGTIENKTISQSARRRGGTSYTFAKEVLQPLSTLVDKLYSDALGGEMGVYKSLKRDYASFARDRAAIKADIYSTTGKTQFKMISDNPKLFNDFKSHLEGRVIDPKSPISTLEQLLKAKSIEGMIDVSVNGDISTVKDSNLMNQLSKNKAKIKNLYSEKQYEKIIEVASHLEGKRQRLKTLDKIDSNKLTQEAIIEEMNRGASDSSISENLNLIKLFMKSLKFMYIPIKPLFKMFMGVKFLAAAVEVTAAKVALHKSKNIANSALALESAPAFKGILARSFADNTMKNGGYYTRNIKG